MGCLIRSGLAGVFAFVLVLQSAPVGATASAPWMPSIVNVMNLAYCIVGIGPCPEVFDPEGCGEGSVVAYIDGAWVCGEPDELGMVGSQGVAGPQGLVGPEGPEGPVGPAGDLTTVQAQVASLLGTIEDLQDQLATVTAQLPPDCAEGEALIKGADGWACQAAAGGGLSQVTQYPVNSVCKESYYSDATWTWGEVFPDAVANGEEPSQCFMINEDQAQFRWNSSMSCPGSGTVYNLNMGGFGPETSWETQAASTSGYIGGVAAASYVISSRVLVCIQ